LVGLLSTFCTVETHSKVRRRTGSQALFARCIAATERQRVTSGVSGTVTKVRLDGEWLAFKRFFLRHTRAWTYEVASHLLLPQPEVIPIICFGKDANSRPWMVTPWVEGRNLREVFRQNPQACLSSSQLWLEKFQSRLHAQGFHWADAAPRNVLVPDADTARYRVVDYTLRATKHSPDFSSRIDWLEQISPECEYSLSTDE